MNSSQLDALEALAIACNDVYVQSINQLADLIDVWQRSAAFANMSSYRWDAVSNALIFDDGSGRKFYTLANINGKHFEFSVHETLVWLATDVAFVVETIPLLKASDRGSELHRLLLNKLQANGIRAAFLQQFASFCREHCLTRTGADAFSPNEEVAQKFFNKYQSNIEALSRYFVDGTQAKEMLSSLSFPTTPCVLGQLVEPDTKQLNGIWMTAEHHDQWIGCLARMQAQGLAERA